MTFRLLLAAAWGVGLLCGPAFARDLTVVTQPGPVQQAQTDAYFTPFALANDVKLDVRGWPGGFAARRSHLQPGTDWDLVLLNAEALLAGCEDGTIEKLNWSAIGGRDRYLAQMASDCGVGAAVNDVVLAWDRDKFPATPNWADFWDVARYPGKRGLRRGARSNLEIALLADGVAPGDVYRTLRTEDGVDRAFRKLEQIKPYLVWWTPDSPAGEILGSGEALLSSASSAAVATANRTAQRHFGVQWNGSLYTVLSWAIIKGSPNMPDCIKLLAFMSDPARQAQFATAFPYGPVVKGANEILPADLQAASPTLAANLANALQVDEAFWRDNGDKLAQRFDAWLAH